MVARAVKERVSDRINELIEHVAEERGIIVPVPSVRYSLRGDTAGVANFNNWVAELNPIFLLKYEDQYITETLGHEVAHFASVTEHGLDIFTHGREWQSIMRLFRLPLRITHRYL